MRIRDHNVTVEQYDELLEAAAHKASNDWERNFVQSQRDRFMSFGIEAYCSVKQFETLSKIAHKVDMPSDPDAQDIAERQYNKGSHYYFDPFGNE